MGEGSDIDIKQEAFKMLKDLADKIGTTTDQIYNIMVKQAKVEAIKTLIFSTILIVLVPLVILADYHVITATWFLQPTPYSGLEPTFTSGLIALCLTGGGIVGIILLCLSIDTAINCFVNPGYYVMNQIRYLVK